MPRLSIYRPEKGKDYKFFDRNIKELFQVGGTDVYIHKYTGIHDQGETNDATQPKRATIDHMSIQDLLLLENRDRKYDKDIYELRGVYNVQDTDFDLTQFGLFLSNDMLYMTFHMNEMVEIMGRRLMPGDVLELPHLRDSLLLNADKKAINKYYVVNDANRGAEGFSQTWYPHIWRVKLSPLTDSQEYYDILGDSDDAQSLKNDVSTYKTEFNISDAIVEAADAEDPTGTSLVDHLFGYDYPTSGGIVNQDNTYNHGESIASGDQFPSSPNEGDYFIRNDFSPNRMFVRRGNRWHRLYDNITDQTWTDKTYNASDYIFNNNETSIFDSREFDQQQAMSNVIPAKPDNELKTQGYVNTGYVASGYVADS